MNDNPCGTCVHYDSILVGGGKKQRVARHGWCAIKSIYPAEEQPGQVFPDGVKRAAPGELASPHIVTAKGIVPMCVQRRDKP